MTEPVEFDDDDDEGGRGEKRQAAARHEAEHRAHRGRVPYGPEEITRDIQDAITGALAAYPFAQRADAADDSLLSTARLKRLAAIIGLVLTVGGAGWGVITGLVTIGDRISTVSARIDRALTASSRAAGALEELSKRVATLEFGSIVAARERASIATHVEEARKARGDLGERMSRIEGKIEDLGVAIGRLETRGKGGAITFPWKDADRRPIPP